MATGLRVSEMEFLRQRRMNLEGGAAYHGASKAVADKRLETCRECEYCVDSENLCIECGCNVAMKRWVPWWFCPLHKFEAET